METDLVDGEISEQKKNHFNERDKNIAFALIDTIVRKDAEIGDAAIPVDSENNLPCVAIDEFIVDEVRIGGGAESP
jgi:hypothetical protein